MMKVLPLLLAFVLTALPAEAKFRPGKFMARAAAGTIGLATAPLLIPLTELAKYQECRRLTQLRAYQAAVIVRDTEYDLLWLENWW